MSSSRTPGPLGFAEDPGPSHRGPRPSSRPGPVNSDGASASQAPRSARATAASGVARRGAAPADRGDGEASERRAIAVIHARQQSLLVEGRWFRLIRAEQWPGLRSEGHEIVALDEARRVLAQAGASRMASKAERAAFAAAASLLADAGRPDAGLLLIRLRRQRYARANTEAPITPSQRARMQPEKEKTEHWIEIELTWLDGTSVANERFLIVTPDNQELEGTTDARGRARVDGIFEGGSCTVSFPDLYDDEWRRA
jgi:hypothetical protein